MPTRTIATSRLILVALGGLLALAGCEVPSGGSRAASPGGGFGARASGSEEDIWAIRCLTLEGPQRLERAEAYAKALSNVEGLQRDLVQVAADDDGAHVYYGRYRRLYGRDADEPHYRPDPRTDLEQIRSLMVQVDGRNAWPFILATLDVLPTYRSSHPEWNLEDAAGYWALHVAVFYNTETMRTRRAAAEEYCRVLREQGEQAYFHHAAVNSSVYVGTYPRSAVVEVQRENPFTGAIRNTLKIVDPQLLAAQERFPHSLHNGHIFYEIIRDPRTGEVEQRLPAPSFPVVTPRAQALESRS